MCSQSRVEVGNTSFQDETEEVEELPLVRHRRRHVSSGPIDTAKNIEEIEISPPSSPQQHENLHRSQHDGSNFPSDEVTSFSLLFMNFCSHVYYVRKN